MKKKTILMLKNTRKFVILEEEEYFLFLQMVEWQSTHNFMDITVDALYLLGYLKQLKLKKNNIYHKNKNNKKRKNKIILT
jgi:hypothetical protein